MSLMSYSRKRTTSSNDGMKARLVNAENVQVTVRCRPLNRIEQTNCWKIDEEQAKVISREDQRTRSQEFTFDNVFYGSDNNLLYKRSISNLINQAMDGYNATVFAYGQTASGKTYTMMGTEEELGIIPRSVNNVFDYIKQAVNREFLLRVSYLEIYNESIRDLLNPKNENLRIHEDKVRGVYVTPLTEEVVTTPKDVIKLIQKGEANRHISSTDYNLHSSRSHTIFQMVIESRERTSTSYTHMKSFTRPGYGNKKSMEAVKISQLNLIDLAGSEKATSNEERRKEGAFINKSLLTLGTVISKLTEAAGRQAHIPFRDSKLTRILQTSLTGLTKVAVICTISPASTSLEESFNTLKFASRVKKITIHAKNDEVMDDKALIQKYRVEIIDLKSKLESANDIILKEKEKTQHMIDIERREHAHQLAQMGNVRGVLKERIAHLTRLILTSNTAVKNESPLNTPMPSDDDHSDIVDSEESLKNQLEKMSIELHSKDKTIEELQVKLTNQMSLTSQLETALSITRAELEVIKHMAKEDNKRPQLFNQSPISTSLMTKWA